MKKRKNAKKILSKGIVIVSMATILILFQPGNVHAAGSSENMKTPIIITEIVADTDNVNGADAWEYVELYNTSNQIIQLDQYELIYNGDIWSPDQSGITIEPGKTVVLWIINDGNKDCTAEEFNTYYGTNLEIGRNLATIHSGGLHNSKERTLKLETKTGEELVDITYNDSNVKAVKLQGNAASGKNGGICFAYQLGEKKETRLGYGYKAIPGEVNEEQIPTETYQFQNPSTLSVSSEAVLYVNQGEEWKVTGKATGNNMVQTAYLYVKFSGEEDYKKILMKKAENGYEGSLKWTEMAGKSGFSYYTEFSDGVTEKKTTDKTVTIATTAVDKTKIPPIVISEIMPDSSNINGADAYEYIELYNNSDQTLDLQDYSLYYNYPDNGEASDVVWFAPEKELKLEPGKTIVLWIKNGKNDELTTEDFNKKFNTNLELNKNLFEIHNGGMANGSARALRLTTRTKEQVDFVAYNMVAGVKDPHADKGITYRYDAISNKTLMLANDAEPTPGAVTVEESPMHAEVRIPNEEPIINNQTVAEFQNDEGVTFSVQASSGMGSVKRVVLQVKDNTMEEYENYNLLKNGDSDVFQKSMEAVDLYGKKYFDYRFIISDGFHTVVTEEKRITSTSSQEDTLRFEMEKNQYKSEDNQYLSGETSIITTGDQFLLDEKDITAETVNSISGNAKILIDVSQTDTFFKNAIAIGDNVIGIFNEGTYENWATVGYDVDASYFVKGDSLTIDIHAGNKANPLEHNEENNDDFVVKNIRLVLPDGRTLRAKGYENPETIINMGDSAGKIEILHAEFTAPDAAYQAIRYDVDTNTLADGEHVFTAKAGGEERRLAVHVDNTPAKIISNIADGEVCKGTYTIEPSFVEEGSGVSSVTAKLDGKKVELPYEFRSLEMTAGEHLLELNAVDYCGNASSQNVKFTIPEENAEVGAEITPEAGTELNQYPVFSVMVQDPTQDNMNVTFKKGERYILGDKNISMSQGVSDTAGIAGEGEVLSGEKVKAQEKIETLNGFPYQQFEIQVGETVTENDQIQVKWKGNSNSEKTKLYVYSVVTGKWDLAETKSTEEDGEKSLTALISLKDHIENGKVKVMVQSGEGYTPIQYEEGAAALPSDNPNVKAENEKETPRNQYDFTFAVESDTQYYNEDYVGNPQKDVDGKYQYQLDIHDWIIANQPRMNIQYLFHDGDIIDDEPLIPEWENADNAYKKLDDAGIPYGILAGNHDVGHLSGDYTNYCKYFGASRYENRPWYGGNNKDNRQHYDLITVGGIDFIMLYTGWGIEDEEIDWMNEVLSQYPERKAILNFHEYLLASGGLGEEPQRVYDEVVSKNPNVCMVLSGHYHNAQTVVSHFDDDGDGIAERNVYQMLFDYQGLAEGGMGYMRLMHFDLDGQRIVVRTYSPSLDDYDAKDNSNLGGEAIVGEEDFEIPFAELGIVSKEKVLSTTDLDVNVYTDQVIGKVENVESGSKAEYTWKDATNGVYGWYAEIKDDFGGKVCTDVRYFSLNRDITAPVITLPEKNEIMQDAEFTIMDGVTAIDDRDGDLTSGIKTSGAFDIHTPGMYTIDYTVSDSSGNEAKATRNITVLEKGEGKEIKDTTAPVLTVPGDVVIKVGEAFDVRKDVSAMDDVDGDLTDKIQISGKFDIRTPGTYVIVYRVSDNAGNTATAERKITVEYNNVVKTGDSTFLGWFGIGLVTLGTMVKIKRKKSNERV